MILVLEFQIVHGYFRDEWHLMKEGGCEQRYGKNWINVDARPILRQQCALFKLQLFFKKGEPAPMDLLSVVAHCWKTWLCISLLAEPDAASRWQ